MGEERKCPHFQHGINFIYSMMLVYIYTLRIGDVMCHLIGMKEAI